jgi:hypothetical protein
MTSPWFDNVAKRSVPGGRSKKATRLAKVPSPPPQPVPADTSKWSEKSQRSYSFGFVKEYRDITYKCYRCKQSAVFSAVDQKYTFEVKKAPIDQRRHLCETCWRESLVVERDIELCQQQWKESKPSLKLDQTFLKEWLELLTSGERYGQRANTAAKNMLRKLLAALQ